ncbi:hypothetical protein RirG_008030 [Rhizophagus irregularis DAOM 197198w]|uniref:Uncharacterized protein n=1 Tax=Rhizophagus irregularis (strain DAOM 197198w) TaxID=1432141 RepID=A0A015M2J0_RHIIW|nr:hypothetical protein RirG_008030 [Rhizophagus irregularis DAOM 197198w]
MKHTSKKNSVKSKGKITPKYAEEAEIELEINDALAEITECTIRFKIILWIKVIKIESIFFSNAI